MVHESFHIRYMRDRKVFKKFLNQGTNHYLKMRESNFENSRLPRDILKKYFQTSELKFSVFFHLTESPEKTN